MDDKELHYITYDPDALWTAMITAYVEAGGDLLYPGDEKEILLRGVQQMFVLAFAGIDNALRMDTLRYAVREYLDVYGEKRNCYRIRSQAARAKVTITAAATGEETMIPAGTALTADGETLYTLDEDAALTGGAQTLTCGITCSRTGTAGNALTAGTGLQFLLAFPAVTSAVCSESAAGGQDEEDDETYRERIRTYGLTSVTTGPAGQYKARAMSVSSNILDASVVNGGAGVVNVWLLLADQTGAEALIGQVAAALSPDDERPLTDTVHVALATPKEYTLDIEYAIDTGTGSASALTGAVAEYKKWQEETIGQAFNPDKLVAMLYQAGCSRVLIADTSEFDGGDAEYTAIDEDEYCTGTISLAVIGS